MVCMGDGGDLPLVESWRQEYMLWFNFIFGLNFLKPVYFFQTSLFFSNQFKY